jgi:hypothetical protein
MRRRTRLTLLFVVLVAAILALIVILRSHAPPEAARLLPGGDGFLYLDLKWVRRISPQPLPSVPLDPDYQQFVSQTGFAFERDLDEAAFAIHYTGGYAAPDGSPRFSEILIGRWDSERVSNYLRRLANNVEVYHDVQVFSIPFEGRTVRVTMLSVGTVAISNVDSPQVIHELVDRSRKLASPFGGPALLRQYYRKVPFGSLAWVILSSPAQFQNGRVADLLPLNSQRLLQGAVVVGSVRFLRAVHLRLEAFYQDENSARKLGDQLTELVGLFHNIQPTLASGGTDADVKQFFDSLKVQQSKERVSVSAILSTGFLQKLFTAPPPEAAPAPTPTPPPQPKKKPSSKRRTTH